MKKIFMTILLTSLIGSVTLTAQLRIYTPELNLPANGALDQMPNVLLNWKAVTGGNTGIIRYEIWMDYNPAFTNPVTFETEFLTAIQTSNLIFGETYYWKVRAKDGPDVSDWSETWSFRVVRRVTLFRPNDASSQTTDVKLEWNAISGTEEYDYQFDTTYFWKSIPTGLTTNMFAASSVDENNAWIAGAGGLILFYDGSALTQQTSGTSNDFYGVFFLDIENGWAVGKSGTIRHFDGTGWSQQTSGTTSDLYGVHFLDDSHGWAFGKGGTMLFYDGSAWSSQSSGTTRDIHAVYAIDANNVFAVGKVGTILYYNGSSWAEQTSGTTRDLLGVGFGSADAGWAVGKTGVLINYDNGVWTPLTHSLTTRDIQGISFSSPDNAWAVGKNGVLLQYDGIEWFSQTSGTTTGLNGISLSGSSPAGIIAGDNGLAIFYQDDAFSSPMATIYHVPGTNLSADLYDLLFGTRYHWRVRAKHSQSVSEWSGARSFNTSPTVELDRPANNSVNQNLNVQLRWKKISNLVSYEIEIDDDPAFGSPIYLATPEIQIDARLLKFGVSYQWRARALHPHDTSAWSTVWNFSTVNSVNLKTPANNATDVKLSPLLSWDALTGITAYQILMSKESTFSDLLVNTVTAPAENQLPVPIVLEKETQYFWKVRAANGLDTSGWSPTWSFTTMPPVGIDEPGLDKIISIYPNPADHTLYIQLKDKQSVSARFSITDLVGKIVVERDVQLNSGNRIIPIDVTGLKNGIYMIRFSDQQHTLTKKLIINR